MSLQKPYPHMYRNTWEEAHHSFFEQSQSVEGRTSIAAYNLLEKDLKHLFEYIEPTTANLPTYSHRTYDVFLRACIEIESNCKIIFSKNRVTSSEGNIRGYADLESPMKLSEYQIEGFRMDIPTFYPFASFANADREHRSPPWYRAYNSVKHDRANNFREASLENVIQACGAVYALIDAQFGYGFQVAMRDRQWAPSDNQVFSLKSVPHWPVHEQYAEFDWVALKSAGNPYNLCSIPRRP